MPVESDVDPLRLKAALRDFIALSAIPAVSVGREPEAVAAGLADSLVEVLHLDFAFVRMSDPGGVAAIEVTRGSARANFRESLESDLSPISSGASRELVLDVGGDSRPCHGIAIPIGVNGTGGLVVAASTRSDFPNAIDRVLLSLTSNHAAIAFANARLIHERDIAEEGLRKARDELEASVTERTAELNVANEELSALRRVATLVAEAAAPGAVLDAVAGEMQALLDSDQVALNRFEPDAEIVVLAHRGLDVDRTPVGSRVSHEGENVTSIVRRTGSPARMENYEEAGGTLAELARATGLRSSVSTPITVEGQVWGVVTASWKGDESPPADTEDRMSKFAHLIGTAIANAEARAEVERLADEQAALRRVAVLVAQQPSQNEVFNAVTEAVGSLLGADLSVLHAFRDGTATVIAGWSEAGPGLPVGMELRLDDGSSAVARIFQTAAPARLGSYDEVEGETAELARDMRLRSAVGAPIFVEGQLWGALMAATRGEEPLPNDAEQRIAAFTELVATAISNAESREALARLADEQAALRRVAELVAREAPQTEVFSAIAAETAQLLGTDAIRIVRYDDDRTGIVVAGRGEPSITPVGFLLPLDGDTVAARVFQARGPSRRDDYREVSGPIGEAVRARGIKSVVGVPVVVKGRLWGAMITGTSDESPMPAGTESRLRQFTELMATAIANAEARAEVERLADEQAALRRVATLVARDAPSTEVFEAVATEVGKLLDTDITVVGRYDDDGAATAIGSWSASGGGVPVGTRSVLGGHNVLSMVAETGEPARVDGYAEATGEAADIARRYGWRSSIAAPIVVEGGLWGVMLVATQRPEPFPAGAEKRLAAFTDLVSTAVANAQAHDEVRRFGEEQAALRRVATLVAGGTGPAQLFTAVADGVKELFGAEIAAIVRFEDDQTVVTVGAHGGPTATGSRAKLDPDFIVAAARETGRAARFDTDDPTAPDMPAIVRETGACSGIASPIVVEGEVWGAIVIGSLSHPLPQGTERRLADFTDLVATAVANVESKSALATSRRRIVKASDETRRRIERDLHDGTQQRLVSLGLAVRAAEADLPADRADLRDELSRVARGLTEAVEDLQELSRGIHPAILSRGGLGPALRELALRSPIAVSTEIAEESRLPEPVEVAAYFVASEALANAAKHSEASRIQLSLVVSDGTLDLSIRDDGVGGADVRRGSGLVGLADRVEALGGSLFVTSPAGSGTEITAKLPLELELQSQEITPSPS